MTRSGPLVGLLLACALTCACSGEERERPVERARAEAEAVATAPPTAWFRDVSEDVGLSFVHETGATGRKYLPETMGAGAAVLDYDGDGRMDLYLVQSGPLAEGRGSGAGNVLLRARDDGRFEDVSASSGAGDRGYGQGVVAADHDGDGDTDLYVLNFGPNVLLENRGDGTFEDVSRRAGVDDARWGSSAVFFDADGDGDLDLHVVNYLDMTLATHRDCGDVAAGRFAYCHPDAYPSAPDVFYRNRGDGSYEVATAEAGLSAPGGKGLGAVVGDVDGDGDPDLSIANDSTPNFLYLNRGAGRFDERGLLLGVSHDEEGQTQAGMGTDFGDVDGDGRLDLFVTNLTRESNALYLNRGANFVYASRSHGIHVPSFPHVGFGTDLADFDLDGDLDLFVTNGHVIDNIALFEDHLSWRQPGQLFLNEGSGRFSELAAEICGPPCAPRVGRAVVSLDYDDDGRLDLLVTENGGPARLFRNEIPDTGHFLGLELRGAAPNREAIGARLSVRSGERVQVLERQAGASYQASHDPRLLVGLGAHREAEVTVTWPGGRVQELGSLEAGRYHRIVEETDDPSGPSAP